MSKEIKLTQNKVAIVDDEDFEHLSQFKWYASKTSYGSYVAQHSIWDKGKGYVVRMHRQIMNFPKNKEIDHIDHDTLNNEEDAARAYDAAAIKYFGEFAKLNFPFERVA